MSEFIWDYQGEWDGKDIKGPPPFPTYKMKKNFDFVPEGSNWKVNFGYSKGYNPPNTRQEGFRFRCTCSDHDTIYATGNKQAAEAATP
jgi:hypothetical protein